MDDKVEKAFFLISLMLKAVDYVFIITSLLKPLIFQTTKQQIQMGVEKVNYMLDSKFQDQKESADNRIKVEQKQIILMISTGILYHVLFLWAKKEGYLFKTTTTLLLQFSYYVVLILAFQVKKDLHVIHRQFERVNNEIEKLAEMIDMLEKDAQTTHLHRSNSQKARIQREINTTSHEDLNFSNELIPGTESPHKQGVALREKVLYLNRVHFEICHTFKKISLYYSCEALISMARITAYSVVPLYFIIIAFLVPKSQRKSKIGTLIFYANFLWANYYSVGSFIFSSTKTACEVK